jgi:hypothetical protein
MNFETLNEFMEFKPINDFQKIKKRVTVLGRHSAHSRIRVTRSPRLGWPRRNGGGGGRAVTSRRRSGGNGLAVVGAGGGEPRGAESASGEGDKGLTGGPHNRFK